MSITKKGMIEITLYLEFYNLLNFHFQIRGFNKINPSKQILIIRSYSHTGNVFE